MLFKQLAEKWVQGLDKRLALGKIKPASVATFKQRTRTHLLPALGEVDVADLRNGRVKAFAESLEAAGLKPKTIREYVALLKTILESYVNEDGEGILDLSKWRNEFIYSECENLDPLKQKRATVSLDAINAALKNRKAKVMHRVFIALATSAGMRVGEMLSIRYQGDDQSTTWSSDDRAIFVRQSVWGGKIQKPKTSAAVRRIDLSPPVNAMLAEYVSQAKTFAGDYLFRARPGLPLGPGTVNKFLRQNGIAGAHALRRARSRYLNEHGCPRNLLKEWLGHSLTADISDIYIGSAELEFRQKHAERIGTGLALDAATLPQRGVKLGRPRKPAVQKGTANLPHLKPAPVEEVIPEPDVVEIATTEPEQTPEPAQPISLDDLARAAAELNSLRKVLS